MLDFYKIKVQLNEMQKLALLHFQQQNIPFSKQIILYSGPEQEQEYLLLERSETNRILLHVIEYLQEKKAEWRYPSCLCLLHSLNQQMLFLEEHFLAANLNLLQTGLLEIDQTFIEKFLEDPINLLRDADITVHHQMLHWYILPQEVDFNLDEILPSQESIWQGLSQLDPSHHELYQMHEQFNKAGKWKEADQLLLPHIMKFKENMPDKTLQQQNRKPKSRAKKSIFSYFAKIKNLKTGKSIYQEEKTIPLNPQEELFRLAMISEGIPGTVEENEGLRAFILINEFLIGRDGKICDLCLSEKTVGRIHARISRHGSHYFIEDLGSANGTYLDGKKLNKHQTYLLPDYCRLKFAELAFYFIVD